MDNKTLQKILAVISGRVAAAREAVLDLEDLNNKVGARLARARLELNEAESQYAEVSKAIKNEMDHTGDHK